VLVTGIPATISALFAGAAAVIVALNRRDMRTGNGLSIGKTIRATHERTEDLRTPSGDPIGHVVERTHDLAAVNAMAVARLENGHGETGKGERAE